MPRSTRSLARSFALFAVPFAFILSKPYAACADDPDAAAQEKREEREEIEEVAAPDPPEPDYLALADAPVFLPRSYFYWGTPIGPRHAREPLVFGLEYALHLPIYSNVRNQLLAGKRWAGAVTLSFEGALRMLSEDSQPVRMPSYRPSISSQLFYTWHRAQPVLFGLRLAAFHYSNGQERCAVDAKLYDEEAACLEALSNVQDPGRALNRKSGNFSTSGGIVELHGRVHETNDKGVAIAHVAAGAGLEFNIDGLAGSMDAPTKALYGWGRVKGSVEGKRRFGWTSLTARGAFFHYPGSSDRLQANAGSVEVVLGPYWLTGLGFFARYYGGRDFYNAFFVDRLQQFTTGISWDGERPLKFKRAGS